MNDLLSLEPIRARSPRHTLPEGDATYRVRREAGLWIVRRDEAEVGVVRLGAEAPTSIAHRVLLDVTKDDAVARELAPALADEIRPNVREWSRARSELQLWAAERSMRVRRMQ